jgi:dihydropteroate synthase
MPSKEVQTERQEVAEAALEAYLATLLMDRASGGRVVTTREGTRKSKCIYISHGRDTSLNMYLERINVSSSSLAASKLNECKHLPPGHR